MPRPTPVRLTRRGRLLVTVVTLAVVAAGSWSLVSGRRPDADDPAAAATSSPDGAPTTASPTPSPTPQDPGSVQRREVTDGAMLLGADPAGAAVAAAEGLLEAAPVVVVAAEDALTPARGVAWRLHAPLLPDGAPGLDDLLEDLGTRTVVTVARSPATRSSSSPTTSASPPPSTGTGTSPPGPAGVRVPDGAHVVVDVVVDGTSVDREPLDDVAVPARADRGGPVVLVRDDDPARALLDTIALAAGIRLLPLDGALAEDADARGRLRVHDDARWAVAGVQGGWTDVDPEVLAWDVEVVRSGVELPGGGLRMFPGRTLVAMYGSPDAASLGVLGEQPVAPSVERARSLAADYAPLVDHPVVPTFEIITTVASGGPEPGGDYSRRVPLDQIAPWVEAAREAGIYVILDLQPGRTDFLTQAREVEPLLRHPHVGLALDPEWRLAPDQVHLRQVGSVPVEEVQAVADWLAELTRRERLPQKLLLLHQFRLSMLPDRDRLQVPPELAVAIQMDGQGSQGAKDATWEAVTTVDPPADVWFGWKNFHDEDTTLRSPVDTLAVEPTPVLVSYQ